MPYTTMTVDCKCSECTSGECADCEMEHTADGQCPRAWCSDCDDWHERDVYGDIICPGWYCETCGDYHDYGDECDASDDCWCESPQQQFTVPNDGQAPLASGARASVHLASGVISGEGLYEIKRYLAQKGLAGNNGALVDLAYDLEDIGEMWQSKGGNYTKRLSRLAYEKHQVKLTPDIMSAVGTIAREHSKAADVVVDVTRDLNKPAGHFYHEGSCWWGSYSESRCALKTNGGFALRSFADYVGVSGRAWVLPLRREGKSLVPTFETNRPDALMVFNGYGELSDYTAPRVLAAMYGWTYKKISGFDCEPMYINAGGYIVGPEDIVRETETLSLGLCQHSRLYEREMAHAA